jgi:hypothetical protein
MLLKNEKQKKKNRRKPKNPRTLSARGACTKQNEKSEDTTNASSQNAKLW